MSKRLLVFIPFTWLACAQIDCPKGINRLPMYGTEKKCDDQTASDNYFIEQCDKEFPNRSEAARYYIDRAWGYFYENQFDSAMMRFNQAWLLDSLNADIYWGYGNILGLHNRDFKGSIVYLEKSLKMNPENSRTYECAATSYGQLFFETKNVDLLNKSIDYLKTSIKLEPNNARAYGQLTGAYSYFMQKDSARKYLNITDKIDPNSVNSEVRKILEAD